MTVKRFGEIVSIETIKDNKTGKSYAHCLVSDEFFDLINTLAEENEQLKKEKDYYKRELQKELVCQTIIDRREKYD